ncbi:hypothetical protein ACFSSC_00045 [Corynebacterium mendelii]|uniref:Uncharacterized protein n=1 Tax=Corynebacterium mendelii TaxID=2765362 RepID=A0A939DZG8_9CORY|nr:hypothetical protein [Corynebacterium mendelii]MBN9643680.1 hypothetical protein [Corynebacterium mendelii]
MLGMFRKKSEDNTFIAGEHTNLPLSNELTMMIAQEIPMLDSKDRARIYRILEDYDGPQITRQEDLPEEIIDIMDLR